MSLSRLSLQSNLPIFKLKESSVVRRRYSDFEWLRSELERDSKIVVPPLPGKAWKRQMPFRSDEGLYEEEFIEDRRRKGLEQFVNKVAGHPLAQNERCLHMFFTGFGHRQELCTRENSKRVNRGQNKCVCQPFSQIQSEDSSQLSSIRIDRDMTAAARGTSRGARHNAK